GGGGIPARRARHAVARPYSSRTGCPSTAYSALPRRTTVPAEGSIVYAAAASYRVADDSAAARLCSAPASVTRSEARVPWSALTFCSAEVTLALSVTTACAAVPHGLEPPPEPESEPEPEPEVPAAPTPAQSLPRFRPS